MSHECPKESDVLHLTGRAEARIDAAESRINRIEDRIESTGRTLAFVVRMSPFSPGWPSAKVKEQIKVAFPGVPVIFVDHGTTIEAIHAAE